MGKKIFVIIYCTSFFNLAHATSDFSKELDCNKAFSALLLTGATKIDDDKLLIPRSDEKSSFFLYTKNMVYACKLPERPTSADDSTEKYMVKIPLLNLPFVTFEKPKDSNDNDLTFFAVKTVPNAKNYNPINCGEHLDKDSRGLLNEKLAAVIKTFKTQYDLEQKASREGIKDSRGHRIRPTNANVFINILNTCKSVPNLASISELELQKFTTSADSTNKSAPKAAH